MLEEKVLEILADLNEEIPAYEGDDLFDAGLLDSLQVVDLVAELEDAFSIEIDAAWLVKENLKSKEAICALIRRLTGEEA